MFENGHAVKSPTKRKQIESQAENREQVLQNVEVPMPCMDCKVNDICKHAVPFHCPDFNPDVFEITVSCKIRPEVYARFAPNDEAKDSTDFE